MSGLILTSRLKEMSKRPMGRGGHSEIQGRSGSVERTPSRDGIACAECLRAIRTNRENLALVRRDCYCD